MNAVDRRTVERVIHNHLDDITSVTLTDAGQSRGFYYAIELVSRNVSVLAYKIVEALDA